MWSDDPFGFPFIDSWFGSGMNLHEPLSDRTLKCCLWAGAQLCKYEPPLPNVAAILSLAELWMRYVVQSKLTTKHGVLLQALHCWSNALHRGTKIAAFCLQTTEGLSSILAILANDDGQYDQDVVEQALQCIFNIVEFSPDLIGGLVERDVVPVLMNLARVSSQTIQKDVFWSLFYIVQGTGPEHLGAFEKYVIGPSLQLFENVPWSVKVGIGRMACKVLDTSKGSPDMIASIAEAGGIKMICELLRNQLDNDMILSALGAMNTILGANSSIYNVAFQENEANDILDSLIDFKSGSIHLLASQILFEYFDDDFENESPSWENVPDDSNDFGHVIKNLFHDDSEPQLSNPISPLTLSKNANWQFK